MKKTKIFLLSLLTAALISAALAAVANDVFALMKRDEPREISFGEEDAFSVGKKLYDGGIISFPHVYGLYCRVKGDGRTSVPGKYVLSGNMSYDEIRRTVCTEKKKSGEVAVTIPEGSTVDDIIGLLTAAGVGTEAGFAEAVNRLDYDFEFVKAIAGMPESRRQYRKYMLEGYLFPDTYFFSLNGTERQAIEKMLKNFDQKFNERYRASCLSQGFTFDDAVTLASIVEKEARHREDFKKIASVFRNRLKSARLRKLESDATVAYAVGRRITADDLYTDSRYNTYRYGGLPPSAVCNPGKRALLAALEPAETGYYYFVSDATGHVYYSGTKAEHDENVRRIAANSAQERRTEK